MPPAVAAGGRTPGSGWMTGVEPLDGAGAARGVTAGAGAGVGRGVGVGAGAGLSNTGGSSDSGAAHANEDDSATIEVATKAALLSHAPRIMRHLRAE